LTFLSFFFWQLYCLSFIESRHLITPLVSSSCSFTSCDVWKNRCRDFQQYISYIVAASFIGTENRRKPPFGSEMMYWIGSEQFVLVMTYKRGAHSTIHHWHPNHLKIPEDFTFFVVFIVFSLMAPVPCNSIKRI
jgi:hypothetical protein